MNTTTRQIECTIPILPVGNLARSIEFYKCVDSWKHTSGDGECSTVCSVSKDGCAIMLSEQAMGTPGAWVWIGLEDDSLFHLWRSRGVKVRQEPQNYPWAYEMKFEDIDGNVLWLGTEPRKDMPFEDQPNE